MAGKIVADTLEHSTAGSVDTQFVVNGSAKAWAKITQDSTHTLNSNLNISSIVDGGTGETDLLFTSSMNDAVYAVAIAIYGSNNRHSIAETVSVSQITIQSFQISSNSTEADATNGVAFNIMGDLA
jgi:hypothetical protein